MNSLKKTTLTIIASGLALPALALAEPGGGGAAIGPVNGSGTQNPQTPNTPQKAAVQGANQYGTMPPNAEDGMSGGSGVKQNTSVNAKTRATSKSLNRTSRTTKTNTNTTTTNSDGQH